jgi:hypothetical protein
VDTEEYKRLFKLIAKTESGAAQKLEEIEGHLMHLRNGSALTYADLEIISDPQYWPFSKYWMWPDRNQIEKKLAKTEGWFKNLPTEENKVIQSLNKIFKHIALVSIVLRFALPEYYAIYSCPVLKILRIERGKNEVEDYLNYIRELRILRDSFSVGKTSDVDQIIWAIYRLQGKYAVELKRILAKRLPENLTSEELIVYLSHNPLKVAREYQKRKDHITAGLWAAKAFEKFLDEECRSNGILIEDRPFQRSDMIKALCEQTQYWQRRPNKSLLYETKRIRNRIVPGVKTISWTDVEGFISDIETLQNIAFHRVK